MNSTIIRGELSKHYNKLSNESLVDEFKILTRKLAYIELDTALHKMRIQVVKELFEERSIK